MIKHFKVLLLLKMLVSMEKVIIFMKDSMRLVKQTHHLQVLAELHRTKMTLHWSAMTKLAGIKNE